ncbi:MAG: DNA-3-methyladenine glycosylase 2 family protein [Burkholderiales bacterium]|nr:DNA-3-methyladenine glycosylase 2 family protein [Burkholderiales bacterium]
MRRHSATSAPVYWSTAKRELSRVDPVLAEIIRRHPRIALRPRGEPFQTLARAIVSQQISVKAALSVWNRLCEASGGAHPDALLRMQRPALRACGLSERKCEYLGDLARHFAAGTLRPQTWPGMDDEALIAELVQVRGIGRWTAEMYLIFNLLRPDVLPLADLGLQRAMRLHYFRGRLVGEPRMRRLGATWSPWRSVATWYLWRSLDPVPVAY